MADFIQQTGLLERLISSAGLRGKVLANNIANQNTPGFTRQDVQFEELLSDALRNHRDVSDIKPKVIDDLATPARPDGNNVQLETELDAARQNGLLARTYMTLLEGHFAMLRTAMERS